MRQLDNKNLYISSLGGGYEGYYSYTTLIAVSDELDDKLYVTNMKYSCTTSRHLNLVKKLNQYKEVVTTTPANLLIFVDTFSLEDEEFELAQAV